MLTRGTVVALLAAVASAGTAFAVNPLVTDDADPVDRGHLQVNAGWQFARTRSVNVHTIPVNPVVGICARGEVGATFGYLWRSDSHSDGITDLAVETKWRLRPHAADGLNVSVRFDVKLPTASERRRLGSGDTDVDAFIIATRRWGPTSLDWNVGYTAVDASRAVFGDDLWFLGQAVRHQLTARWTVLGETFGIVPQGGRGGAATAHLNGGAQLLIGDDLLLSALIGSAVGRRSPDFTAYLGFTWQS